MLFLLDKVYSYADRPPASPLFRENLFLNPSFYHHRRRRESTTICDFRGKSAPRKQRILPPAFALITGYCIPFFFEHLHIVIGDRIVFFEKSARKAERSLRFPGLLGKHF